MPPITASMLYNLVTCPHRVSQAPRPIWNRYSGQRGLLTYTDVVRKATEWPTRDYSIKTLAKYLGFKWRDAHPSGAASIEWFARWVETGDPTVKQRILDYNQDDCKATRVLLDGIRALAAA